MVLALTSMQTAQSRKQSWPVPEWPRAMPAEVGMDEAKLLEARDHALTGGGSGCITRTGKLVLSWGDPRERYDLKSTTKSIGVTALGLAIQDGKMKLTDKARLYQLELGIPPESNREHGWVDDITLFHLATQTAGFEKPGGYAALEFARDAKWSYSDVGPGGNRSFPTKWMSDDGKTLYPVFSDEDSFSARKATLMVAP